MIAPLLVAKNQKAELNLLSVLAGRRASIPGKRR